ncbi:MAG: GPR endopeptidase, partial [Oscillospiraceae bacterium]|nr:GPR endopeptidase [Oscillospiraceae bacterium]
MLDYRTDLALESLSNLQDKKGIAENHRGKYFQITEIVISDDESGKPLGKGKGTYITLETEILSRFSDNYEQMAGELAQELRNLLPETGSILVAGLGNKNITPDALGVRATEKILATRHLQKELAQEDEEFLKNLRSVSVLAGGVLGQTGIESAELLKAIVKFIQPEAMIVIDALACSALERLGTTIQISDTGIAPGSGVANHRMAINAENFGIPIIAIGVPTVIGIRNIAEDFTGQVLAEKLPDMMVTPRDIDRLIIQASHLLACGINMALHPQMQYTD